MLTSQKVKIFEILYILDFTLNLLLLSQFKKTKISYYNKSNYIIMKIGN